MERASLKLFQPFLSCEQLLHEAALAQGELLYQGGLLGYGGVPKGKNGNDALLLGLGRDWNGELDKVASVDMFHGRPSFYYTKSVSTNRRIIII